MPTTTSPSNPAPLPPWIARQLQSLLAQRAHAWLLQGPAGLGQWDLALALARAWLCEARATPEAAACGQCPSCHAISVRTHADLLALMPEAYMPALGWPLPEKAQAEIDDKKRKPSREIRVEAMRDAIEFTQSTNARGRGKVLVVYPAERMNPITANALLKTLEEPPGDTRFVLASKAAHLLLPTIRSRCLAHTMAWPEPAEALVWLQAQGVAPDQAPALLQAAGGRPAAALTPPGGQAAIDARQWALFPRAMAQGDVAALADLPLPEAVSRLQKLCHDVMVSQQNARPRFFEASALPKRALSTRALTQWWKQLQQSARNAEHPLNAGLATEFLVSAAQKALNSKVD
ncbi:MAG: DNA polymerase III subunit delta' [Burkholderiaceae bacterium]|jgi:DNA polymerase-3 subunit delta'|nr:DNA polymerase III subunit delta' [Burkholderiaceae bacterium]